MKNLFLFFILLLFSFCSKKRENNLPRIIVPEQKNVVEVNSKEMLHNNFVQPIAFNFNKDTTLSNNIAYDNIAKNRTSFKNHDTILPKYNFKIIIDTSYSIIAKGFEYKNLPFPENIILKKGMICSKNSGVEAEKKAIHDFQVYLNNTIKLENDYVRCYPLLIYNDENNSTFFKRIEYIQQAKDVDGVWKPIEFFFSDIPTIFVNSWFKLNKNKYVAIPIIKYHGNFKTKLRVKIRLNKGYYYSNEISGSINNSQFNLGFMKKYGNFFYPQLQRLELINLENQNLFQNDL